MRKVPRERALELWIALARDQRMRAWQLEQDRKFYDLLGEERSNVQCRGDGCRRGAVTHSVLCRAHHFESVWKRPSPFSD
jgi:hypothetical protein